MTKNVIAVVVGSVCAMFLWEARSVGQEAVSGTSLVISGTASISGSTVLGALAVSGTAGFNALDVVGVPDFQNNTLFFGTSGTGPALSVIYDDGGDSSITLQSTRPTSVWNWSRLTVSGSSTRNAMQLDASNRLILTGTAVSNPPQLVLDPNGAVSLNGSNLLTQAAADVLYFSATAGLVASGGNIGIGTTSPTQKLDVRGNLQVATSSSTSALFVNTATGGVGIGTNNPVAKLQLEGAMAGYGINSGNARFLMNVDTNNNPSIELQSGKTGFNAGNSAYIDFAVTNDSDFNSRVIRGKGAGGIGNGLLFMNDAPVYFTGISDYAGASSYMSILTNGNVGIATTTPQAKLDVNGNANVSGTLAISGSGVLKFPDGTVLSASNTLRNVVSSGTISNVTLGGTTSIQGGLNIAGTASVNGQDVLTADVADSRYFSATAGLVASNGNFGIGTNAPQTRLHVNGSAKVDGYLTISGASGGNKRLILDQTDGPNGSAVVQFQNGASYMFWFLDGVNGTNGGSHGQIRTDSGKNILLQSNQTSSGGVGIGAYAAVNAKLHVLGYALGTPVAIFQGAVSQTGDLTRWQNSAGTVLSLINKDGFMGLGTANPQAELDVNGTAKIAGNLALSATGSLTLPDGTVLSASNTLRNVVSSGTISNVTLGGTTNIQGGLNIAGTASVNGSNLLTATTADARYIISGGTSGGTVMGSGTASAPYTTAMGQATLASGWWATAMGYGNIASGDRAVAMGIQNLAEGANSVAMGISSVSHGFSSLVSGVWSRAWGDCSLSFGDHTWAGGNSSLSMGQYSWTGGLASVAMGDHTLGSGHSSISLGAYTTAIGDHSQSLGYSATAQSFAQTVIGQFNILPYAQGSQGIWMTQWQPTDELFTIGNGTDQQHPSNAVVVKKNGDTTVYGKLTVSGTANVVLINPAGDLSMGDFTDGAKPQ